MSDEHGRELLLRLGAAFLDLVHEFVDLLWFESVHELVGERCCLATKCLVNVDLGHGH